MTVFLADLQACGRAAATQRSYSMALLRWFRFLWAVEVPWDEATRVEDAISSGGCRSLGSRPAGLARR